MLKGKSVYGPLFLILLLLIVLPVYALNVGGGNKILKTLTMTGTGNRITGTDGYIDFNDNAGNVTVGSGLKVLGPINTYTYRQMTTATDAILDAAGITLYAMSYYLTPPTNEIDVVSSQALTYKNVVAGDIGALGVSGTIDGAGGDEYMCTGADGTCADSGSTFSIIDGTMNGFLIGLWANFEAPSGNQVVFAKWEAVESKREYQWQYRSTGVLRVLLYDESDDKTCTQDSTTTVSMGWHFITVLYDGAGGVAANTHVKFFMDGLPITMAAPGTCTDYTTMSDTSSPFQIGAGESGASPFQSAVGPWMFATITGATDISTGGTPTFYDATVLQLYNTQRTYLGL